MKIETLLQSKGESSTEMLDKFSRTLENVSGPILDLGCGTGTFLRMLANKGKKELYGCDGYFYSDQAIPHFKFSQCDLNKSLPFKNETFEAVSAIEVIEHLENPRHLIREIVRVLKPGGKCLISTPNTESLTSIISLILRGYPSSFSPRCYPAHITPILGIDLLRIFSEAQLATDGLRFSQSGRIPGTALGWQTLFPFLNGKLFSDNYWLFGEKR